MGEPDMPDEALFAWARRRRELVQDLMRAEALVSHGEIRLTYHAGRYVGMDVVQRRRLPRAPPTRR